MDALARRLIVTIAIPAVVLMQLCAVSVCRKLGGGRCEGSIYSCSPRGMGGSCDGKFKAGR